MDSVFHTSKADTKDAIFAGGGEMGALMRSIDWSQTPLGPVEQWPQSLHTALSICLLSRFPMLLWWGPELVMLYNDAYRPILGTTKHPRSMGQQGRECWPEIWDVIGPMLEGVLHQGEATWSANQLLLLDRNGYVEECYFTFSYSPIRNETGSIAGIFTAVNETTGEVLGNRRLNTLSELSAHATEAKTVEEACRVSIAALKTNSADIPFALLYLLDEKGESASLEGYTGLVANTPASQQHIIIAEATQEHSQWPLAEVVQTRHLAHVDTVTERFGSLSTDLKLDTLRDALVLPVAKSGQDSLYGLLVVGVNPQRALDDDYQDFFELVAGQVAANIASARASEEERRRLEELAALDQAKTTFFSNISHEFRTPLTLLLGPTQDALIDESVPLAPVHRERLETVRRNGLRLLKLVNTLLDFSRIESGRIQALYEPTDLARLTTELASTFRSTIERAGLHLLVDCPPLSKSVYVDREMWEKIVLNLLSNAFKFTYEGQISVRLRQEQETTVCLEVQDSGIGIAPEDLTIIFERFQRVRNAQGRTIEGSGIGLSLVQELIHLHGGTVSVSSIVGEGTLFSVSLPLGYAHLPQERIKTTSLSTSPVLHADPYIEEVLRWLPSTQHLPPAIEMIDSLGTTSIQSVATQGGSVLVVDDNADMRDYLAHLFSPYYTVLTAANGSEALPIAQAQKPDLVLSDVMMPVMDGFQLLHALRENVETTTIPVILLSARAGEEASADGLTAGADDYLVKPFSARDLLTRVSTRIELSRMRLQNVRQAQAYSERLQQLAAASLFINSIHPIEETLALITAKARELIGTHQAITGLTINNHLGQATKSISLSEKYAQWRDYDIEPGGQGIYMTVGRTNKPMRLTQEELEHHPAWQHLGAEETTHPPMRGWLATPLMLRNGQNIGLIQLSDKYEGDFTEEDEAILVQLAQLASVSIENAYLYQQSQDGLQAREQLLSMVSHDLKNPLGAIKGYIQLLLRGLTNGKVPSPERTQFTLERMHATVIRMTNMINELLDLTRLQAGKAIDLSLRPIDLIALIKQVIAEQQQTTQKHAIHLRATLGHLTGIFDEERLERVFSNLLSNAIKYSPDAQEINVSIEREAESEESVAVIAVRDYGIGIPQQEIPYIFEQFRRAFNVVGDIKGTGIGLASAYEITKLHGGTITVESVEGEGSTFIVRLPLHK